MSGGQGSTLTTLERSLRTKALAIVLSRCAELRRAVASALQQTFHVQLGDSAGDICDEAAALLNFVLFPTADDFPAAYFERVVQELADGLLNDAEERPAAAVIGNVVASIEQPARASIVPLRNRQRRVKGPTTGESLEQFLLRNIRAEGQSGCWHWLGWAQRNRRGLVPAAWVTGTGHVAVRRLAVDVLGTERRRNICGTAKRLFVTCGNDLCVQPEHLTGSRAAFLNARRELQSKREAVGDA